MPFSPNVSSHLPRRNARSLDLDVDSAAKAAAWVWHLHTSKPGITTEGRFISSQSRRRSSGSYDRKVSRFQQEASTTTTNTAACENKSERPVWDCGSNLYDTFELVAFGNRLDRSLMEVVPITPSQAHIPKEHHMKSPLHKSGGILRTLSLPRSLSWQSKNYTNSSSGNAGRLKLSSSYNNGTRERTTGSGEKVSTKWRSVGKLMNIIKKVVDLHKQLGCKRSTNVIECSQRPLEPIIGSRKDTRGHQLLVNGKSRAKFSSRNSRDSECMDDELSVEFSKARCHSDSRNNYKLTIPSMDNSNYESNYDTSSMQEKIRASNAERLGDGLSLTKKIRSHSESMSDGLLDHNKIKERIKGSNLGVIAKERIRGSNLGGVNATESIKGANHHLDLHKHLHHHHHHHHHHHYLHHNLASESARLSPETMSHICAEESWLI